MTTEILEAPVEAVGKPIEAEASKVIEKPEDFVELHGLRVDLLESAVKLHLSNGSTRILSYTDFSQTMLSFLNKSQEAQAASLRSLPPNVYAIEETVTSLIIGMYFPETVRDVNFVGNIEKRVVPNILLTVTLTKVAGSKTHDFKFRNYQDAKYFATNLPLSKLPKGIVKMPGPNISILPFSNIYPDGYLCMGGNSLITDFKDNDLRPVSWYHDMLWASPFNTDLGVRALRSGSVWRDRGTESWFDHLAELAKASKGFPYLELQNMK